MCGGDRPLRNSREMRVPATSLSLSSLYYRYRSITPQTDIVLLQQRSSVHPVYSMYPADSVSSVAERNSADGIMLFTLSS